MSTHKNSLATITDRVSLNVQENRKKRRISVTRGNRSDPRLTSQLQATRGNPADRAHFMHGCRCDER